MWTRLGGLDLRFDGKEGEERRGTGDGMICEL